jgi:pimeloyl-ACP methyl ester carboxylesterase
VRFLFDDPSFSFEALRTAGQMRDGGADLGEVISTCARIGEGDTSSWHSEWRTTADRVHNAALASRAAGSTVSSREGLLRAANYYRTAEFFLREDPANDADVTELSRLATETFREALDLMPTPVEVLRIPYEDTTLPGYLFLVDDTASPRPTILITGGFDSTAEETYFVAAAAGLRRGYNVLAFDGPGQGAALREQGLFFRHDWERVVTPVVDYALSRAETDPERISLLGYSLGGLLAARAGAFEHRLAALALYDGMYSFHDVCTSHMPPFLVRWIDEQREDVVTPLLSLLAASSTQLAWGLGNGAWAFGASSAAEFLRMTAPYTLDGVIQNVTCPTLVMDGESDHLQKGEAERVFKALAAPKEMVHFTAAEGAGEHCQVGAMALFQQRYFAWLDHALGVTRRPPGDVRVELPASGERP